MSTLNVDSWWLRAPVRLWDQPVCLHCDLIRTAARRDVTLKTSHAEDKQVEQE